MSEPRDPFVEAGTGGSSQGSVFDLGSDPAAADDPFAAWMPPSTEQTPAPQPAPDTTPPAPAGEQTPPPEPPAMPTPPAQTPSAGAIHIVPPAEPAASDDTAGQETDGGQMLLSQVDAMEKKNILNTFAAKMPVLTYNGAEEEITALDQTFEELRAAKIEDFPEFDEAKNVSWTVTYGPVSKPVPNPRKDKIGAFKREIETSKAFLDGLKKAKDKNPKCMLKPIVRMEKKGTGSYRGVFTSLEEAQDSGKAICIVPGQDGKVYEMRRNAMGEFITPTAKVYDLGEIHAGFRPALPPIPYALFEQIVSLFRAFMFSVEDGGPTEALAQVFWDKESGGYFIHVPRQEVDKVRVIAHLDDDTLFANPERYIHYCDVHSHNDMRARFSPTDNRDERANRVYIVVGRLDKYYPDVSVRICNGGNFLTIPPETVLEPRPMADVPARWLDNIVPLRPGLGSLPESEAEAA